MEKKHAQNTDNDHPAEFIPGKPGQVKHTEQDQHISDKNRHTAYKAPGFTDGGINEIRPVRRYVVQLGNGAGNEHAVSCQPAGSDGHFGHGLLVSIGRRIHFRIQPAGNPGKTIVC